MEEKREKSKGEMVEVEGRVRKQEVEIFVVSIAVKRILDHSNSYTGKNIIGPGFYSSKG